VLAARERAVDRVTALAAARARLAARIADAIALLAAHAADVAQLDAEILALIEAPADLRMRLADSTRAWVNRCGFAKLGAAWPGPAVPWQDNPPSAATLMQAPALELAAHARDSAPAPARKPRGARASAPAPAV
jgi:hypothetical protein